VVRDPRLRERHYGPLQGLTAEEAVGQHANLWQRYRAREPDLVLPGGESLRQFHVRIATLLDELLSRHRGQRVLLVTHGGVLDAAYRHAMGMALQVPRNFAIHNASINVLRHHQSAWQVMQWGDIEHLKAAPPLEKTLTESI